MITKESVVNIEKMRELIVKRCADRLKHATVKPEYSFTSKLKNKYI